MSNSGNRLFFSDLLGGSNQQQSRSISSDGSGGAFLTGYTQSSNFPTTSGVFDTTFSGTYSDCFVSRLNSTGSQLIFSTLLGPGDGRCIISDGNGGSFITGGCGATFPTTPGAFDTSFNSNPLADAYVVHLNDSGSQLLYSTFLGGSSIDAGLGVALVDSGEVIVTGSTSSNDFPITHTAFDSINNGHGNCFIAWLNPIGSQLL